MYDALNIESITSFNMTVNEKKNRNVVTLFDFNRGYHEIINIAEDNTINYTRTGIDKQGSFVNFKTLPTFGKTAFITTDNNYTIPVDDICINGCSVYIGNTHTNITIHNLWGGHTTTMPINSSASTISIDPINDHFEQILSWGMVLGIPLILIYIIYKAIRRIHSNTRD
jgi:hypothetical protein